MDGDDTVKITFFIGSLGNGGAERVISILANHYAEKQWDVDIVLLLKTDIGYCLNENINIVDLTSKNDSYVKSAIPWMIEIRKYVKMRRPDRIVSFIGRINMLVIVSTLGLKVPVVVSERNDPKRDGRGILFHFLLNRCYLKAKKVIFQTQYQQNCFSSKLIPISEIIPNPIEIDNTILEVQKKEHTSIVTVGRYSAQKNQRLLMEAVNDLKTEIPGIKLELYGDGELREEYKEYINRNNLEDTIILKGIVKDILRHIKESSLFVLTSKYEGMSNALLEAQMLGMPCVVTDYPGATDVIQNGYNGIIIQQDNKKELCEAIRKCLSDDLFSKELGNNAYKSASKYYKENVIKHWEKAISC